MRAAAAVLATAASLVGAATADADTKLTLDAKGSGAIRASAVSPARARGRTVTLPISSATSKSVRHRGGLRLRAGRRSVSITSVEIRLGRRPVLRGALGGRRQATLFTLHGPLARGASLRPTATTARTLERVLKLRRRPSGRLGKLTLAVPAQKPGPDPGDDPTISSCPGGPKPLARPASAVDVTSAPMTWHLRDSFTRYINGGQGTSVSGGATADPPRVLPGTDQPLVYDFHYAFKAGWTDPASGRTRLAYRGRVSFKYKAHLIDIALTDPEIEIDGKRSRAIFCGVNFATAGEKPRRSVLVELNVSGGLARMPGTVPADAAGDTFSGYYLPNEQFGWIGVAPAS